MIYSLSGFCVIFGRGEQKDVVLSSCWQTEERKPLWCRSIFLDQFQSAQTGVDLVLRAAFPTSSGLDCNLGPLAFMGPSRLECREERNVWNKTSLLQLSQYGFLWVKVKDCVRV